MNANKQNVWNSNAYKLINKILNKIFNSQLLTNDRRNDVDFLHYFRIFVDLFCFNDDSFERYSTSQRGRMKRSSIKKEKFNLSLRDEAERKRKIMWRAYIEFNIWNQHMISH